MKFDVVHVHYPLPWMFYIGLLKMVAPWRLVLTFHGNDAHDLSLLSWIARGLVGLMIRTTDSTAAVSRSLLAKLKRTYPRVSIDGVVIPTGFPEAWSNGQSGTDDLREPGVPAQYILTVGQLIHRKGIDVVIRALALASSRGLSVDLVVVGEGPERGALAALAAYLHVEDHIHLLGSRAHESTRRLFGQCAFFVLGSRAEGLPLVVVETMASGKPVVATAVNGVPDLVEHGRSGLLVESEDATGFGEAIELLARDPVLCGRMGAYARRRVAREYSWRSMAQRYARCSRVM
jgi:glycosyltransferase involved in cell wall biosynthesis